MAKFRIAKQDRPCEEPHEAEVAGVLPGSTPSSVDLNESCIRLTAESALLSKARSVAPRRLERAPTTERTGTFERARSNAEAPQAICTLADWEQRRQLAAVLQR